MPMITAAEAIIAAVDAHLTGTDLGTYIIAIAEV